MKAILLRHCKSSWDRAAEDHERPLSDRGVAAARRMGNWMRREGHRPDRALVSDAQRTRETFEGLGLDLAPEMRPDLYLADAEAILAALPTEGTVLLVAHNPGIAAAARRLAAEAPTGDTFARYPSGACTVLAWDGPPRWGEGRVVAFTAPKLL
ncbi:histidine phosphatase family protein [Jannaschia sp. W003]|uniref:SixA phosphatase family protein n=1 Tax=Jannaschia sp. W003 TaxID=2867012 RepID=UPI0021A95C9D|nr:histidine phosphatase family protein [Jannaschia sp. W003]UWQ21209.1 histidine phosphatase family protein [Jannaschia sp. W003]